MTNQWSVAQCDDGFYVRATQVRSDGGCVPGPRESEYFATAAEAEERRRVLEKSNDARADRGPQEIAHGALLKAVREQDLFAVDRLLRDHGVMLAEKLTIITPGVTALHVAVDAGAHDVLTFMLARGASPNVANHRGWLDTPLHIAVKKRDLQAAEILLAAGANMDAQNCYGHTPERLARELRDPDLIALFDASTQPVGLPKQRMGP